MELLEKEKKVNKFRAKEEIPTIKEIISSNSTFHGRKDENNMKRWETWQPMIKTRKGTSDYFRILSTPAINYFSF